MAQGLKVGDGVTVSKTISVTEDDPAFSQGVKQIRTGRAGQIVKQGTGRSFIVDFSGKQVNIPSRWLERIQKPDAVPTPVISTQPADNPVSEGTVSTQSESELNVPFAPVETSTFFSPVAQTPDADLAATINYNDRRFITAAANKLLVSGSDPQTLLIQIRFNDLPAETQTQVQALIHAKLALGPDSKTKKPAANKPGAKRRGPKPRNPSPEI